MRESGHRLRVVIVLGVVIAAIASGFAWSSVLSRARGSVSQINAAAEPAAADEAHGSFSDVRYSTLATRSIQELEHAYYNGAGYWHMCLPLAENCNTKNRDWGADALTNVLYLHWALTGDHGALHVARGLVQTSHYWRPRQPGSSDNLAWDAVADVRLYQMTGSKVALRNSEAALQWLDTVRGLATGKCPTIDYQWPGGARGNLKTIETTTNYIKAALLLYRITGKARYLSTAEFQYRQVRRYFLASPVPVYTAYMFDNGRSCDVLPGRYFASVNGNMIWAGRELAGITGKSGYLSQAIATARAVEHHLSDGNGVFADLQSDNDIVGPLVEAMYALAKADHLAFARRWLLVNASAAGADINKAGQFGRFFDGPAPTDIATAQQISGGIDLMQAAAALDPHGHPADPGFWNGAVFVPDYQSLIANVGEIVTSRVPHYDPTPSPSPGSTTPPGSSAVRISFTGQAIAIMGTIGAQCCVAGHARVLVDGVPTFDQTGIWQNFSSPSRLQHNQVLFAWRWRTAGHHVITVLPARYDNEEGGTFFRMLGYELVK